MLFTKDLAISGFVGCILICAWCAPSAKLSLQNICKPNSTLQCWLVSLLVWWIENAHIKYILKPLPSFSALLLKPIPLPPWFRIQLLSMEIPSLPRLPSPIRFYNKPIPVILCIQIQFILWFANLLYQNATLLDGLNYCSWYHGKLYIWPSVIEHLSLTTELLRLSLSPAGTMLLMDMPG